MSVGGNTAASYSLTRDAAGSIASLTETVAGANHDRERKGEVDAVCE